jgi:hypothetical protein
MGEHECFALQHREISQRRPAGTALKLMHPLQERGLDIAARL